MGVVLGFQPADEENVSARLELEPLEQVAMHMVRNLGTVWNDADGAPVAPFVDLRHRVRVRDRACGQTGGEPLGAAEVRLREAVPLTAIGVEAVDVDEGGDAGRARDRAEGAVAGD